MAQKLDVKTWAITAGIIWGGYLFLFPFFVMSGFTYYWFSINAFILVRSIYPGLTATVGGAFIGLLHGAICGAICGGLFALVHNWILKYK
jgi:hypothetical protein